LIVLSKENQNLQVSVCPIKRMNVHSHSHDTETTPTSKLVLLGQSAVGKTTIINVAEGGPFVQDQSATIGACFHMKKMKMDTNAIRLHIWDTAGQERFRALAPLYYRDAQFALLVYSIDSRDSFNEINTWYKALQEDCSPLPEIAVVANKVDLVERRQISLEEGRALSKKLNASFFEVSAKANGDGVRTMLQEIAIRAISKLANSHSLGDAKRSLYGESGPSTCGC
jgi:small GTP-binding protein